MLAVTTDDKTVLTAAHNMIERYGDNVMAEIDLRIAELQSLDQTDAQKLWVEIRSAVELIKSSSPGKTRH